MHFVWIMKICIRIHGCQKSHIRTRGCGKSYVRHMTNISTNTKRLSVFDYLGEEPSEHASKFN